MPGICIQCALERFARGEPPLALPYTESEEEHVRRYHADLTPKKRSELLQLAVERMERENLK